MPIMFGVAGRLIAPRNYGRLPISPSLVKIVGFTKDSTGAALPGCVVCLYETFGEVCVAEILSDANGRYQFDLAAGDGPFFVTAYKAGAPDQAGTTVNTLVGV